MPTAGSCVNVSATAAGDGVSNVPVISDRATAAAETSFRGGRASTADGSTADPLLAWSRFTSSSTSSSPSPGMNCMT